MSHNKGFFPFCLVFVFFVCFNTFFFGIITHERGGITVTVTLNITVLLILSVSRSSLAHIACKHSNCFWTLLFSSSFSYSLTLSLPLLTLFPFLSITLFEVTISLFSSCVFDLFSIYFPGSILITFNVHETQRCQLPSTVLLYLDLP